MYTGIPRKIDSLGRIVIPKEIRTSINIHDGDYLEIGTDGGEITLRKYYPYDSVEKYLDDFACYMRIASERAGLSVDNIQTLEQAIENIKDVWIDNFS